MLPRFLPKKAFRNHPIVKESKTSRREGLKYRIEEKKSIYNPAETTSKRFTNAPAKVFLINKFKFNKQDIFINIIFSLIIDALIYIFSLFFEFKILLGQFILLFTTFFIGTYLYRNFIGLRYNRARFSRKSRTFAILSYDGIFIQNNQFLWKDISSIYIRTKLIPHQLKNEYFIVIKEHNDMYEYVFSLENVIFNKTELEYLFLVYKKKAEGVKTELNPNFEKTFLDFKYSSKKKYIIGTYHVPDLGAT